MTMVSILTRSKERVLHPRSRFRMILYLFQSSPAPKSGCYNLKLITPKKKSKFQSSPAPKSGCYSGTTDTIKKRQRFQSSPAPKSGCYVFPQSKMRNHREFQSSPAPKSGCYAEIPRDFCPIGVSILTRSKERVLHLSTAMSAAKTVFQSSPAPKSGCYRVRLRLSYLR